VRLMLAHVKCTYNYSIASPSSVAFQRLFSIARHNVCRNKLCKLNKHVYKCHQHLIFFFYFRVAKFLVKEIFLDVFNYMVNGRVEYRLRHAKSLKKQKSSSQVYADSFTILWEIRKSLMNCGLEIVPKIMLKRLSL